MKSPFSTRGGPIDCTGETLNSGFADGNVRTPPLSLDVNQIEAELILMNDAIKCRHTLLIFVLKPSP